VAEFLEAGRAPDRSFVLGRIPVPLADFCSYHLFSTVEREGHLSAKQLTGLRPDRNGRNVVER